MEFSLDIKQQQYQQLKKLSNTVSEDSDVTPTFSIFFD